MIKKIVILIVMMFVSLRVDALTFSENSLKLNSGKSATVNVSTNTSVSLKSIEFSLIYSTYDVPAYFSSNHDYDVTNTFYKVNFNTPVSGDVEIGTINVWVVDKPKDNSGSVTIKNVKATDVNGNVINLNSGDLNVIVIPVDNSVVDGNVDKPYTRLLKDIKSDIVDIELKDEVFDYYVEVNDDVVELDLVPIAGSEKVDVSITNQKISELDDNKIVITVSDGSVQEIYNINVKVNEKIDASEKVEIDYEDAPEYHYKWKWIVGIIVFGVLLALDFVLIMKKK